MKKISRRSFLAAAAVSAAALALTACGGASSSVASSVASSAAASSSASGSLATVVAGKLTMATNATFPPYEMTTDSGEIEGIDIDTAKAIAEKLGLELQVDDMEFALPCSACSRARLIWSWLALPLPTSARL